jgi:hypothetical protein
MASLSPIEETRLAIVKELIHNTTMEDGETWIDSVVYTPENVVAGILKMREFAELVVLYDVLELVEKPDLVLKQLVDHEVCFVIASSRIDTRDWSIGGLRDLIDGVGYTVSDHRTKGDWQVVLAIF